MGRGLAFPFDIGDLGLPRTVGTRRELVHQLHQLLFTLPGERVNRPDFGIGIQRLVFTGASTEAAATAEYLIRVGVRRFMADRINLETVRVEADGATLHIDLLYTLRDTGEEQSLSLTHPLEAPP